MSYNINIITGSMPHLEDERLLNIAYLCRRDGTWESYHKIHPTPSEVKSGGMSGGNKLKACDTDSGRIGILICYDVEFPELSRLYVKQGVQILFVPFLTDTQNGYNRVRRCAQARDIENECYVAIAGCVGNLPQVNDMDIQYAQSAIFTPSDFAFPTDAIGAQATPNTEMILIADVNLELLKELHEYGTVQNLTYAARDARWRYIRYADGSEELYNHDADPHEWTNLASAPEHAAIKSSLAAHFPAEFKTAQGPAAEVVPATSPAGSVDLVLVPGDELSAAESPKIQGRGIYLNASFDYNPEIDGDSTLLAHGDAKLGYALHLVASRPTLTIFVDGKATAIAADTLEAGKANVRALIANSGFMSVAVPGKSEVLDLTPFESGFPAEPAKGLTAGQSFGPLSMKDFPNSTPFDSNIRRLNVTIMPATEVVAKPLPRTAWLIGHMPVIPACSSCVTGG